MKYERYDNELCIEKFEDVEQNDTSEIHQYKTEPDFIEKEETIECDIFESLSEQDNSLVIEKLYVESEYEDEDEDDEQLDSEYYNCNSCDKYFKTKSSLESHFNKYHIEAHENDNNIEVKSNDKEELARQRKRDFSKKRYLCPHCGKMVLSSHIIAHAKETALIEEGVEIDDKPYACDVCGLKYKTSNSLTKHKRKHSNDKRYECEHCGEKFLHWASRRNHVYLKHTGERRFECHYCSEKFYQRGKYNVHLRRHTNELPFQCDFPDCNKKFITNVALKNHSVCHSGERNHACEVCKKTFGRKKSLVIHMKIHTGEKNYICPVCNKAFIQNHVLRTHMKSHPEHEMPAPGTVVSIKVLNNKEQYSYPQNMFFPHYNGPV